MNKSKSNDSIKKSENNFYITTPIYYASGKPHLGHAYTSICSDALARWNRDIGKEVFFLTGTDEHGQKVQKKAIEAKKTPKEFVDDLIPEFKKQLEVMNISYDYFIRTTDEKHKSFIQKMLQKSFDNGDIYKGVYEGLYCIDCEQYYKTEDLLENNVCPVHKKKVESVKEENYFFRLSKYQNKLLEFYKNHPEFLSPKSKAQETINRVKEELIDISISRSKKTLSWGIELPFDKSHVTYVWFDALFNYVSALEINGKKDFWPADVHVVGKDIMWFHKVYWPAFLMSTGYDLPKKVFAHGWWTVNGEKMGKALGNVIDPIEVAEKYGVDEFRYFVISGGTFGDDMDFSYEKFAEKINNELNNDFGNLISRVHAMTTKYFDGKIPKVSKLMPEDLELLEKLNFYIKFNENMQELKFNFAIEILWNAIRETNAYINKTAPYKESNKERLGTILNILCSSSVFFAKYASCFMPKKAQKIFKQFNVKNDGIFKLEFLEAGHKLGEKENLFTKIEIKATELKNKKEKTESKLKAVIFDFDGVIHDTFEIGYNILKGNNANFTHDDFRAHFDGNVFKIIDSQNKVSQNNFRDLEFDIFKSLKLEQNIRKELELLAKKYELYIISSNSIKNLNMYFENNNFTHIFKDIMAAETHKSKEEKFKILFEKYKLNNENCIFITDTVGDILEANKVKLKTIAVDFGFHENERLKKVNPYKLVSKFEDIRKEIEKETRDKGIENREKKSETKKEGFSSLNLKVGKIIEAKHHPNSEKLFIEKIDVGEKEPRQIVSGLVGFYTVDELIGKKVIVAINLKPAKLRGEISQGMVLAAENVDGTKVGLLLADAKVGENLVCNKEIADNEAQITIDDFLKVQMISKGDKIYFNENEITVNNKSIKTDKNIVGKIK